MFFRFIISQVDYNQETGRFSIGVAVTCRVTLKDGTFHEVKNNNKTNDFILKTENLLFKIFSFCDIYYINFTRRILDMVPVKI